MYEMSVSHLGSHIFFHIDELYTKLVLISKFNFWSEFHQHRNFVENISIPCFITEVIKAAYISLHTIPPFDQISMEIEAASSQTSI